MKSLFPQGTTHSLHFPLLKHPFDIVSAVISKDNLDFFIAEDQEVEIKRTWKTAQRVQQEILKLLWDDTKGEPTIPPP